LNKQEWTQNKSKLPGVLQLQPFSGSLDFIRDYLGELVPKT